MDTEKALQALSDKSFLDKLYGYAYRRCNTSQEAEDLCSDIIFSILKSLRRGAHVERFYAFAWKVAARVYADFCEKRRRDSESLAALPDTLTSSDLIAALDEATADEGQVRRILQEIAFLSRIYREVMVMYYLDGKKVSDIASALGISETAVKQRLFSARNMIRKEVSKMEKTAVTLRPIAMSFIGNGSPIGNDPRVKAERALSQNLVYLCKNKARTAKELSEELGVAMPFIEEELDIQCRGENGEYGLLRKTDDGRYIANILIFDMDEYRAAEQIFRAHAADFSARFQRFLQDNRERILSFPFLSPQSDVAFVGWCLVNRTVWTLSDMVTALLKEKYFADVEPANRPFSTVGYAMKPGESLDMGFYGCDGVTAENLCGYSWVFISNAYGNRLQAHFHCGHNLSQDPQLMLTLRAVGGLDVASLHGDEQEIAAKAIENGYLRKKDGKLYPKFVVVNGADKDAFWSLASTAAERCADIADAIAGQVAEFIRRTIPAHLISEYALFSQMTDFRLLSETIEACIASGALTTPNQPYAAEGVYMELEK